MSSTCVSQALVPAINRMADDRVAKCAEWTLGDLLRGTDLNAMDPLRRLISMFRAGDETSADAMKLLDSSAPFIPLVQTLKRQRWSETPAQVFSAPPPASSLDSLQRFYVFGFDFKIDSHCTPQIIEINGINSGVKGFARSHTTVINDEQQVERADRFFEAHLRQYGAEAMAYIGTVMALAGMEMNRFAAVKELFTDEMRALAGWQERSCFETLVHPEWHHRYFDMAAELASMERMLEDKSLTDAALEPWREYKPRSYKCSEEGLAALRSDYSSELIVCKDRDGSLGKNIVVGTVDEIQPEIKRVLAEKNRILEPYVESRPIYCAQTDALHDGCARYVIVAEQDTFGEVLLTDIGGYWRLSPEPIDRQTVDSRVANLARKAIAVQLSDGDRELMSEVALSIAGDLTRRSSNEIRLAKSS